MMTTSTSPFFHSTLGNSSVEGTQWNDIYLKDLPVRRYRKADFLYFEGDSAQYLFFVKKGVIKTSCYSAAGKELIRSIVYPGEVVGELVFLGVKEREEFAQAITDTEVFLISFANQDQYGHISGHLYPWISQLIRDRMTDAQRRLESVLLNDALGRIASFLIEQWKKQGKNLVSNTALVRNYLTHEEIANYVGTTRQTVSSSLNRFRKMGLISFDRYAFLIKDLNGLISYQAHG